MWVALVLQRCPCRLGEGVQRTFEFVLVVERVATKSPVRQYVSEIPYLVGELPGGSHYGLWPGDGDVRSAHADVCLKGFECGEEILLAPPVQRID